MRLSLLDVGSLKYVQHIAAVVYIVKKLGKNGLWNAVSLIDKNGSFRGEAKFETKEEADSYMADYIKRLKNPASATIDGKPAIKVFKEDSKGTVSKTSDR